MIERAEALVAVRAALRRSPVVALIGPRQVGKTTLARHLVSPGDRRYFDLEDPTSLARLDAPTTALGRLRGVVVIDEVQRSPDLFPVLRVLADRRPIPARFLVLGSAAPEMLRQSSESLAGRLETVTLRGFSLGEVAGSVPKLWRRGSFPRSYLARAESASVTWRREFIRTYLERDVPQLGSSIPAPALLRFWTMLAHRHGTTWNGADMARSMGVSEPTARRYLDLLTSLFLVRQLQPWHENIGKRQIRSPKVYVRDSGLLHALLGLTTAREIESHPKLGASWEGFVIEEILEASRPTEAYFWGTYQGAELDLLMMQRGRRYGVEVKYQDAPTVTPSMRIAMTELGLERLTVVYPGDVRYDLDQRITVVPLAEACRDPRVLTRRTR